MPEDDFYPKLHKIGDKRSLVLTEKQCSVLYELLGKMDEDGNLSSGIGDERADVIYDIYLGMNLKLG